MKKLFNLFATTLIMTLVMDSCSPTSNPPFVNSLNKQKTKAGTLHMASDTNIYVFGLQCGCAFELKIVSADTGHVHYDLGNSAVRDFTHTIKGSPKAGLPPGTYIDSLTVMTVKPDTSEDFTETLRDTVVVP
jgi:hypothetical protein